MTTRRLCFLALLAPLAACADDGLGTSEDAVYEGTPEAVGVLRFLNGPDADVATLDVDAALDVRAARNIVAHVRGADGVLGTADDDLLADLAELDAIAQVGPATIDRILAFVESIGGVPRIEVEGVLLTDADAAAMVAVANLASLVQLDEGAALDSRAASNIVAARPIADVAGLAAVPYVGASALDRLRRYAPTWTAPAGCDVSLTPRADAAVTDFDELLRLATTGDWPYAEIVALQAPACLDLGDAATRADLTAALVAETSIDWQYPADVRPTAGILGPGAGLYLSLTGDSLLAIEEHVADGAWDPNGTPAHAELYARRGALYQTLTERPTATPSAFYELRLRIEAAECSQIASALLDPTDGRIWVIHHFPGC